MSTLRVEKVSRSFGDLRAVDDVSLVVPHGTLTAVLGPSGCGKTTLLRLVAGFLEPDGGTIAFDDRVVAGAGRSATPQQRRVGYVPQEGALFPHLDVAANIAFGLPRRERRSARVGEVLDLVELPSSYLTRHPHELSGGQQQRVALARALAPQPAVVLLDEPFSSLDASLRESTGRAVARALRAAGSTAVLVTHDQSEALSLADQVAVMRTGRLVQAGTPSEVYLHPVDAHVARFVGGANVLPARGEGATARCALGEVRLTGAEHGDVLVVVRPEQLMVHAGAGTGAPALVREVSFYGHDADVRLELADGATVVARVSGHRPPAPGEQVALAVDGASVALASEAPAETGATLPR
ncbi:MAG: ABC transporter ATP-binding protein [Marmoricola sp.]